MDVALIAITGIRNEKVRPLKVQRCHRFDSASCVAARVALVFDQLRYRLPEVIIEILRPPRAA